MKIIITGRHSSGKKEVIDALESYGIKVGREFCTLQEYDPKMYIDSNFEHYNEEDVLGIFENNAYLYMSGTNELDVNNSIKITRGVSQYAYDNCDAIALTTEQITNLNHSCLRKDKVIIVWLDNNLHQRINRHSLEGRTYSFKDIEDLESEYEKEFVNAIYEISKNNLLYFTNEDPQRVALIVRIIIEHPEYLDEFIKIFI